ncbi:hypothetical protein V6Z11_D09G181300 [Gossypium hirsutum]
MRITKLVPSSCYILPKDKTFSFTRTCQFS